MSEQKEKVFEMLDKLNLKYEAFEHKPVFTVDEIEALKLPNSKYIAKNLFLRDEKGKEHFIIVIDRYKKADLKKIRNQLNTKQLSFASEERLFKYLKLHRGSVTPLGIINDTEHSVNVVFDKDLVGRELIGVHSNENDNTVFISFESLKKFIEHNGNKIYIIEM